MDMDLSSYIDKDTGTVMGDVEDKDKLERLIRQLTTYKSSLTENLKFMGDASYQSTNYCK